MCEGGVNLSPYLCFAYSDRNGHFFCSALNVKKCEYPNCKTFKTEEQCRIENIKCRQRLKELGRL